MPAIESHEPEWLLTVAVPVLDEIVIRDAPPSLYVEMIESAFGLAPDGIVNATVASAPVVSSP